MTSLLTEQEMKDSKKLVKVLSNVGLLDTDGDESAMERIDGNLKGKSSSDCPIDLSKVAIPTDIGVTDTMKMGDSACSLSRRASLAPGIVAPPAVVQKRRRSNVPAGNGGISPACAINTSTTPADYSSALMAHTPSRTLLTNKRAASAVGFGDGEKEAKAAAATAAASVYNSSNMYKDARSATVKPAPLIRRATFIGKTGEAKTSGNSSPEAQKRTRARSLITTPSTTKGGGGEEVTEQANKDPTIATSSAAAPTTGGAAAATAATASPPGSSSGVDGDRQREGVDNHVQDAAVIENLVKDLLEDGSSKGTPAPLQRGRGASGGEEGKENVTVDEVVATSSGVIMEGK
jgi:hypothetical protein